MGLDKYFFVSINQQWFWPPIDKLMAIMSSFAFWVPLLVLIACALLVFGGRKGGGSS